MSKKVEDLLIEYREEDSCFVVSINNVDIYTMSPSQFYYYINKSIGLMNSVIMNIFNKSVYEFMNTTSDFDKFRFKEGDGAIIAEHLSEWLKARSKEGGKDE